MQLIQIYVLLFLEQFKALMLFPCDIVHVFLKYEFFLPFEPKTEFPSRGSTGRLQFPQVKLGVMRTSIGTVHYWTEWRKSCFKSHRKSTSVCPSTPLQSGDDEDKPTAKTKYFNSPITTTRWNHGQNFEVCLCCCCWAWEQRLHGNIFICNEASQRSTHVNSWQQWHNTTKSKTAMPTLNDKNHLMKDNSTIFYTHCMGTKAGLGVNKHCKLKAEGKG